MIRTLAKRRVALVAFLAAASGAVIAQPQSATAPPRYRVELIVFANGNFSPDQELFEPQEAPLSVPSLRVFDDEWLRRQQEAANLPGATQAPAAVAGADGSAPPGISATPAIEPPFRLLSPQELELTPQYQRLEQSRNWRPILHGGWVQDVVAESRTESVRLTTLGVHNPAGTISLYRNNFLHLRLDVVYEDSTGVALGAGQDSGGAGGSAFGGGFGLEPFSLAPRYRLEQSRQTRSGVVQHFDHPAFGVLVKVTEVPRAAPPGAPQRPEP